MREASLFAFARPGAGRQQEIPHVGTGKINLGADLLQRAEAAEECLPNPRVVRAHPIQKDQGADRGRQNKQDQAAKPDGKHQRGPQLRGEKGSDAFVGALQTSLPCYRPSDPFLSPC